MSSTWICHRSDSGIMCGLNVAYERSAEWIEVSNSIVNNARAEKVGLNMWNIPRDLVTTRKSRLNYGILEVGVPLHIIYTARLSPTIRICSVACRWYQSCLVFRCVSCLACIEWKCRSIDHMKSSFGIDLNLIFFFFFIEFGRFFFFLWISWICYSERGIDETC